MLIFDNQNIFSMTNFEAWVNPVNTEGVMGAGLAKQFKIKFPDMFKDYENKCKSGLKIGEIHIWDNGKDPKYILNFPTKDKWKNPSKMEFITKGLKGLAMAINDLGIKSIAIPAIGCGLGGLDFEDVKSEIERFHDVFWKNISVVLLRN
jgi:O-acetyl-ADP-ribose deacetylase (regulator of RNase III)